MPIAILSYFIYPLLTGIIGALIGIDKLELARRRRGAWSRSAASR